jgi:imidazolonepropionase-like amidohydrolase
MCFIRRLPLLLLLAFAAVLSTLPLGAQDRAIAFVNVSVVPMDREVVLADQTVIVQAGQIKTIGPASKVAVPDGAERIDGRGRFLLPTLAEMHGHIPPAPPEAVSDEAMATLLRMYVDGGIGLVRGMLGHPRHLEIRKRAASGAIVSPVIYTSGPSLNGKSAPNAEIAAKLVREQKQAGYDLLKIHPGITRDTFETLAATAKEVGIRFSGHVPVDVGVYRALELGYETIDHLDGYVEALAGQVGKESQFFGVNMIAAIDDGKIPDLVAKTKAAGTWMVPTEALIENVVGTITLDELKARPEIVKHAQPNEIAAWSKTKEGLAAGVPAADRQRFVDTRRRLIRALHAGGVPFLLGSDAPQMWNIPGYSVHRELQALVAAGLTPYQALQSGTVNVARFYRRENTAGTIAAGKTADLFLITGNPLENINRTMDIVGVMVRGRYLPRTQSS